MVLPFFFSRVIEEELLLEALNYRYRQIPKDTVFFHALEVKENLKFRTHKTEMEFNAKKKQSYLNRQLHFYIFSTSIFDLFIIIFHLRNTAIL